MYNDKYNFITIRKVYTDQIMLNIWHLYLKINDFGPGKFLNKIEFYSSGTYLLTLAKKELKILRLMNK